MDHIKKQEAKELFGYPPTERYVASDSRDLTEWTSAFTRIEIETNKA